MAERERTDASRLLLVAAFLTGIAALAVAAFVWLSLEEQPHGVAGSALGNAIGGPFALVDQNGHTVTEQSLKGKWALIYFGYTHCPDACPTALNNIALALEQLGEKRDEVRPVFITVDPERDTPAVMKSYVASFDAPIVALSGSADAVAQAAKAYRVYYAKHNLPGGDYEMDHSSVIYVMDPEGRFTATFTHETSPKAMAERLEKLLS